MKSLVYRQKKRRYSLLVSPHRVKMQSIVRLLNMHGKTLSYSFPGVSQTATARGHLAQG